MMGHKHEGDRAKPVPEPKHPTHGGLGDPGPQDGGGPAGEAEGRSTPRAGNTAELERLTQEAAQAKDQYLRMLADVENTRKRLQREKEEFARFAAETVVRALLPILDSLDQALVAVDRKSDADAVVKGVHLIHRQLHGVLEKEGVRRIPTVGEPFDPHRHEAVAQVEADGMADDTIVEEVQAGYTMSGKMIRPAIVKVAKAKEERSGLGVEGSGQMPRTPNPEPRTESD
ncbi:MAG: nucleotide exchange factor GrpE [Omnitrophica WOR_2 bacterium RIFCSPHIGHO2_02_FULL_67_20]|nr:MAG: nucleotide exchange factor GrpE [Omnitrophica WOR_2 bacterium RIFCSPHIGHO2_02_FULL_67_20]